MKKITLPANLHTHFQIVGRESASKLFFNHNPMLKCSYVEDSIADSSIW